VIDTSERAYMAALIDLRGRIVIERKTLKKGGFSYVLLVSIKSCHLKMLEEICKTWGGSIFKDGGSFKLLFGTAPSVHILLCCNGFFRVKSLEVEKALRFYESFRSGTTDREVLYAEFREIQSVKRKLTMVLEKI
jgi:hypothetical protein